MSLRLGVLTSTLVAAALALAAPAAAQDAQRLTGDLRAHDPSSIVREGETYYLFFTGRGVQSKTSTDLLAWTEGPSVFPRRDPPAWTREAVERFRGSMWAPDVIKVGDRYLLYYSVSRFGEQTSAIGLATNTTLDPESPDYAWEDKGPVIQSSEGDPYNAIDPSLLLASDGRLWMAYGSYWEGIHLIELDPETGLRLDEQAAPKRLAHADSIEAATLIQRGDYYYLFINHGTCCRGVNSTYHILVGRSESPEGPYLDKEGRDLADGGGTLILESEGDRIGPGHVAPLASRPHERFGFHYYDGSDRGRSKLGLASWEWSDEGWPTATHVQLAEPRAEDDRDRRRRRRED